MLFADGAIKDEERIFVHVVKGKAGHKSPEFEALFAEVMKIPQERHSFG
jgi:hypothetical protein